jgi:hypothetical protein
MMMMRAVRPCWGRENGCRQHEGDDHQRSFDQQRHVDSFEHRD